MNKIPIVHLITRKPPIVLCIQYLSRNRVSEHISIGIENVFEVLIYLRVSKKNLTEAVIHQTE